MDKLIKPGATVGIDFKVYDEEGNLLDECPANAPLTFVHGEQTILPALEKALLGKKVNDTCAITLAPDEAYGASQPQGIQTISAQAIPEAYRTVGNIITITTEDETPIRFIIREDRGETLLIDFNHPLAGLTLTFHLHVRSIL